MKVQDKLVERIKSYNLFSNNLFYLVEI